MGSETMTEDPAYRPTMSAVPPPAMPQRVKRKSAKAAAAFVTAAIKEEMSVPPAPTSASKLKRSYSRGNSHGSHGSSASSTSAHGSSSQLASAAKSPSQRGSHGASKKKTALSTHAVEYLKRWMMSPDHIEHPYPTEDEKAGIMRETGIELKQLTNWFVNNRKRYWKPKVEELRRRSVTLGNATLQEMAAAAQEDSPPLPGQEAAGTGVNEVRKNQADKISSTVVSSEGEESAYSNQGHQHSGHQGQRRPSASNKKRKIKASVSPRPKKAHQGKKLRLPVANPIQTAAPVPEVTGSVPKTHMATTHASVNASRKMSRVSVSEASFSGNSEISSEEEDNARGINVRGMDKQGKNLTALVSNPLLSVPSSEAVNNPVPVASSALSIQAPVQTSPPPSFVQQPPSQVLDAGLVAELDYSISPLDNQVVANTGTAAAASAAAAAAGFCCNVMPHSCNLADPLGNKIQPCALCSACRDWNLGEFCPWDLTGIIGDVSPDGTIPDPIASANYSTVSGSEGEAGAPGMTTEDEEEDFTAPVTTLPPVASSPYDRLDEMACDGTVEEATTVTKNSIVEVADVASIDGGDDGTSPFVVPHEISHSSSAADFMSSMVDIESW